MPKLNSKQQRATIGFRAVISGAQSVPQSSTPSKITFTSEQFDYGSNFTNSAFTAPVKGLYHLTASCCVLLDTAAGPDVGGYFYVNDTMKTRGYNGKLGYPNATVTDTLELNAGDVVDYRVASRTVGANIEDSTTTGYFAGHLIGEVA